MLDRSLGKTLLIWLTIAVFGLGGLFGAVATWRGVGAAAWGTRTAGTVTDVHCATAGRGATACHGNFTATAGRVRVRHALVQGSIGRGKARTPGKLVRAVNTWGVTTVQREDTVYVGNQAPSVVGGLVLAVVLTLLTLVILGPALVLIALRLLIRIAGRRG